MSNPTNELVDHFFRHESANLVAVLTRAFGLRRIDLIEDMVQVAVIEAMEAWQQRGVPENPAAWIHQAAKHRILDALRREQAFEKALTFSGQTLDEQESIVDRWLEDEQLPDSLLRMMFVCCHPTLDRKTQVALTLKTLCGFSVSETARGLMLPAETVKKRIQRAKAALAEANPQLALPCQSELSRRRDAIHDVLYLLFNEGYSTSQGVEPIRDDVCEEASRLCHLLCESPLAAPATKALMALFLFHGARLDARTDGSGGVILLEDQDRSRWDRELVECGLAWLARSKGGAPTLFHLEATIAMLHATSPSVAATDWSNIVSLYDRLLQLRESPLYVLNRAIALGELGMTETALQQLGSLRERRELRSYLLLDCAVGRVYETAGNMLGAKEAYLAAFSKAEAPHEQQLLQRKLSKLAAGGGG